MTPQRIAQCRFCDLDIRSGEEEAPLQVALANNTKKGPIGYVHGFHSEQELAQVNLAVVTS